MAWTIEAHEGGHMLFGRLGQFQRWNVGCSCGWKPLPFKAQGRSAVIDIWRQHFTDRPLFSDQDRVV